MKEHYKTPASEIPVSLEGHLQKDLPIAMKYNSTQLLQELTDMRGLVQSLIGEGVVAGAGQIIRHTANGERIPYTPYAFSNIGREGTLRMALAASGRGDQIELINCRCSVTPGVPLSESVPEEVRGFVKLIIGPGSAIIYDRDHPEDAGPDWWLFPAPLNILHFGAPEVGEIFYEDYIAMTQDEKDAVDSSPAYNAAFHARQPISDDPDDVDAYGNRNRSGAIYFPGNDRSYYYFSGKIYMQQSTVLIFQQRWIALNALPGIAPDVDEEVFFLDSSPNIQGSNFAHSTEIIGDPRLLSWANPGLNGALIAGAQMSRVELTVASGFKRGVRYHTETDFVAGRFDFYSLTHGPALDISASSRAVLLDLEMVSAINVNRTGHMEGGRAIPTYRFKNAEQVRVGPLLAESCWSAIELEGCRGFDCSGLVHSIPVGVDVPEVKPSPFLTAKLINSFFVRVGNVRSVNVDVLQEDNWGETKAGGAGDVYWDINTTQSNMRDLTAYRAAVDYLTIPDGGGQHGFFIMRPDSAQDLKGFRIAAAANDGTNPGFTIDGVDGLKAYLARYLELSVYGPGDEGNYAFKIPSLRTTGRIDTGAGYYVNGLQVGGPRGLPIADATDAASVITQLNAVLAHLRTTGSIAT